MPRQVLDGTGDAGGDVQLRATILPGLAHLQVVGGVACIHRGARGTDGGAQLVGQGVMTSLNFSAAAQARPPETMILAAVSSGAVALGDLAALEGLGPIGHGGHG